MHASIGVQDFTAPSVTVLNFTHQSANVNVVAGPIIFWHGKVPEWNKELEMVDFYCLILCFYEKGLMMCGSKVWHQSYDKLSTIWTRNLFIYLMKTVNSWKSQLQESVFFTVEHFYCFISKYNTSSWLRNQKNMMQHYLAF